MEKRDFTYYRKVFAICLLTGMGLVGWGCSSKEEKPSRSSEAYHKAVSDFYISLAAIQSDQALFAVQKMQEVADQYPNEAAAWSNLAVFAVRLGNFELATERIQKAVELAPQNADVRFLAGLLESRQGNVDRSLQYLEEAAELDPSNVRILYIMAQELERQGAQGNREEITDLFKTILEKEPGNLAVLLEMVRISAKWQDKEILDRAMDALNAQSKGWPETVQNSLQDLEEKVAAGQVDNLTFELAYLRNGLNELPEFQNDLRRVQFPPNEIGFLITEFLWLPEPSTSVKPADGEVAFNTQNLTQDTGYDLVVPVSLTDGETSRWAGVKEGDLFIGESKIGSFPAVMGDDHLSPSSIATIDYNYDFRNDLAVAGSNGFELYEIQMDSSFTNVTQQLQLPGSVTGGTYRGVWARDIDSDGDLDIILSPISGATLVLQNNGDDTFSRTDLFSNMEGPVQFHWADMDGDADQDGVFLTPDGTVEVLLNERAGVFVTDNTFRTPEGVISLDVADIDNDGVFDLVSWNNEGIWQQSLSQKQTEWDTQQILTFENGSESAGTGREHLFVVDLDNNGSRDLLISENGRSRYWLSSDSLAFDTDEREIDTAVFGFADLNSDNRLDGVGVAEGQPVGLVNSSERGYQARIIRPEASGPLGDQRINSFGIGGELETRSGLLYQRHLINRPWVHVGLGDYEEAEMLRIIWPNGSTQAEFAELGYGSKIMNEQMLKGSCPWVFAHNGEEMEFITDFLWRTALGLRINAQGSASVIHSIDWIKIEGDQLKPKNEYYDIRITADLWETHFFDHVSLMVVDHPEDTEVLVDERFTLPAPEQKLYPVGSLQPVAKALDQDQKDVTGVVASRDGKYVDTFELTAYQGLAKEHHLELHLGEDVPKDEPVYLVAHGWVYPTDSSINVAISQGDMPPPHGLFLQVPDGKGGWKTVRDDIGFPAGKSKTVLVNLSDLPLDDVPEKIRLTTNMEIYWDQVSWAAGKQNVVVKTDTLMADVAELRYRGFSEIQQGGRFIPDTPNYQTLESMAPKWVDLVGHYTRFGDVRELTEEIDDRYVIMNAGDELVFKFPAMPPPPEGWKRDFVLIGDGWVKDGDYNTGFSKTVIPLPYHGMEDYSDEPGRLVDDPVYQKHREDWVNYHTRYITPREFQTALRFNR